jgi:hypothetical protein
MESVFAVARRSISISSPPLGALARLVPVLRTQVATASRVAREASSGASGSRTSSVTSRSQCRVSRVSPRLRWCRCRAVGGGELRSRGLCRHAASGEDRTIAGARGDRLFREECLGRSSCDHLSARLAEWQPTRRSPVAVTGDGEWDGAGVGPDRRTTGRQACARLCHGVPALASAVAFEEAGEAFHSASHEPLGLQPTALNNSRSFGRTPTSPCPPRCPLPLCPGAVSPPEPPVLRLNRHA